MAEFTDHPLLSARFSRAFAFAHDWHLRQVRKNGKTPYIAHLMAVSSLVLENGGSEDQAIAGLLHDSVEDAGKTLKTLRQLFGPEVEAMVSAVSLSPGPAANFRYAAAVVACPPAALVSACDKLHNLRGYASGQAEMKSRHAQLYALLIGVYIELGVPIAIIDELKALLLATRPANERSDIQKIVGLAFAKSQFGDGTEKAEAITGCSELGFDAAAIYEDEKCTVVTSIYSSAIVASIKPNLQVNGVSNPVLMVQPSGEILRFHGETYALLEHLQANVPANQ